MIKIINVIKEFHPNPYGRDDEDAPDFEGTGSKFRDNLLAPALKEHDKVHVVLDGYNRYGPSFLDEAFGGLIRACGFSPQEIEKKLTYQHSELETVEMLIADSIKAAASEYVD